MVYLPLVQVVSQRICIGHAFTIAGYHHNFVCSQVDDDGERLIEVVDPDISVPFIPGDGALLEELPADVGHIAKRSGSTPWH